MEKKLAIKILNEVLRELKMNPSELSLSIGKSRAQGLYDVLNENKPVGISKNLADLICKYHPSINKAYLLTGDGSVTNKNEDINGSKDISQLIQLLSEANKKIKDLEEKNSRLGEENVILSNTNNFYKGLLQQNNIDYKQTGTES